MKHGEPLSVDRGPSGEKTLLKQLIDLSNTSIAKIDNNTEAIDQVRALQQEAIDKLILLIKQLELVTGEEDYGKT